MDEILCRSQKWQFELACGYSKNAVQLMEFKCLPNDTYTVTFTTECWINDLNFKFWHWSWMKKWTFPFLPMRIIFKIIFFFNEDHFLDLFFSWLKKNTNKDHFLDVFFLPWIKKKWIRFLIQIKKKPNVFLIQIKKIYTHIDADQKNYRNLWSVSKKF